MNDFNFFEYLLIMSLRIQCYKSVDRNYLLHLLSELNENCDCDNCTYCTKLKIIRSELRKTVLEVITSILIVGELLRLKILSSKNN